MGLSTSNIVIDAQVYFKICKNAVEAIKKLITLDYKNIKIIKLL